MTLDKETIVNFIRAPIVKIVTRVVLYGVSAICGTAVVSAAEANEISSNVGTAIGGAVALIIAILIDRWHNKKDKEG